MAKKKVVITGADGTIGGVLAKGMRKYKVIPLDTKECDLRNFAELEKCVPDDTDCIIHMAWSEHIYDDGKYESSNVLMALNVLELAARKHIPRVVLASSVHVREYRHRDEEISVHHPTWPTSIYGATKVYIEELGKYFAGYRDLEVIAVRLGGVNRENSPLARDEDDYKKIWLSHEDLVTTFRRAVKREIDEDKFEVFYAVSSGEE